MKKTIKTVVLEIVDCNIRIPRSKSAAFIRNLEWLMHRYAGPCPTQRPRLSRAARTSALRHAA